MPRLVLTDEHWSKLKPIMLNAGIYNKGNLRLTVEGILYRLRVGCAWRDLPEVFGRWNSVFKRFNDWSKFERIQKIFFEISKHSDQEWIFIDGSIVKAHQHSSGAANGAESGIGKSRAGNSTKIHLAVDSYGLPVHFEITGGQVHDSKLALPMLSRIPHVETIVADGAYSSNIFREVIDERGGTAVIPRKSTSRIGNGDMDWGMYKYRHLVENAFARLKHFRALATRYDKLKRNYQAMVGLACTFMWLGM